MAKIALLAGDGVGPEVTAEALKVLEGVGKQYGFTLEVEASPVGGAAIEACGDPCPPETLAACRAADAILFGAVGDPRYEGKDVTPEQGILTLRRELELFANLRPVKVFASLVNASTLKPEVVEGVDIMVVRELTGGVYFGEPRGVEDTPRGKRAFNTLAYTEFEIERIARLAFETARKRSHRVASVDKANALETFRLWREKVTELGKEYPDVALEHMYVDNASMQLVRRPKDFDVILTGNMFGDILSDEASQIAGSIGLLPSASLGVGTALYEPIHGSAPDIAGQGIANPCAAIMSAAMMLRYSLNLPEAADAVERAVEQALDEGNRTADLAGEGTALSTAQMGDVIAAKIA